jgi:hypothetical protein
LTASGHAWACVPRYRNRTNLVGSQGGACPAIRADERLSPAALGRRRAEPPFGIPPKPDDRYELAVDVDGKAADQLRIRINGRMARATWNGERYVAPFRLRRDELEVPVVQVAFEWSRTFGVQSTRLLEVRVR